ncbi:MAG: hypothetical protein J6Y53_05880 [Alphaproteobacteria bacterium]|nr:hypothetical protein [Alphaproteobacteria bacterium]
MSKFNLTKKSKAIITTGIAVAATSGITTLYLCKDSIFKNNDAAPQQQTTTLEPKVETEKSVNVCDYSMVEAFQKGLINSVSDYVRETPYKVDTIKLNINECSNVRKGYYTQISNEDTILEKYITVNFIDVDTTEIPEALKKMVLKFAKQTNDSVQQQSVVAHEAFHATHDYSKYNLKIQERGNILNLEEIMARFIEFSYLRENYKVTGDSTIFKSNFSFYQYALRRGEINPQSTDSTEQRAEQLFVLENLFNQSNQNYGSIYDKDIVKCLKEAKDYNPERPNQYQEALDDVFKTIWDGKLVNVNPVSTGELEMPTLPENTQTLVNCLTTREEYRIDSLKTVQDTTNLFLDTQNSGNIK